MARFASWQHGPHPSPPAPDASIGPRQVAMWPPLITILVLTGCPVSKGPLRLGNLYLKIISDFGVMPRVTTGVGLSLTVTKPFRCLNPLESPIKLVDYKCLCW